MQPVFQKLIIALYTAWIIILGWPFEQYKIPQSISQYPKRVALFLGNWQGWNMFAPNPISTSYITKVRFTFKDDSRLTFGVPHRYTWDTGGIYKEVVSADLMERYRKWATDYIRTDEYSRHWQTATRYLYKRFQKRFASSHGIPIKIELIRIWQMLPRWKPGEPIPHNAWIASEKDYTSEDIFFTLKEIPQ